MAEADIGELLPPVSRVIRLKPLLGSIKEKCFSKVPQQDSVEYLKEGKVYNYTKVFDEKSTTLRLFEYLKDTLVEVLIRGYNMTVNMLGQSGSGKTFTMGTADLNSTVITERSGLLQRTLDCVFTRIQPGWNVQISYFEVRNHFKYLN